MALEYYSTKKKSSKIIVKTFTIILLTIAFYFLFLGGKWLYENKEQFLFYFEKNQYAKLIQKLNAIEKISKKDLNFEQDKETKKFTLLIEKLSKNKNADAYFAYLKGKLYYLKFQSDIKKNKEILWNLFFYQYLNKYQFPSKFRKHLWLKSIINLRRALILDIPKKDKNQCRIYLGNLYLWGGKPYWDLGMTVLKKKDSSKNELLGLEIPILQLYNILLQHKIPDWTMLRAEYPSHIVSFWEALYYLKSGNTPRAYSIFNTLINLNPPDLLINMNSKQNINQKEFIQTLKNNSLYLLGQQMKKNKEIKKQFYYYSQIDLNTFMPKNPWFLKEYHFLLRFLGKNSEASQFLIKYEKKINSNKK